MKEYWRNDMEVNLSGKVCGRLQAKRLDLQRKYKRNLTLDDIAMIRVQP